MAELRFRGRLDVGTEPFDYRVLAGDAVTRFYHVTPRPRPYIATFTEVYHYPAYTGLADATLHEPDGHLEALEGTQVELTFAGRSRSSPASCTSPPAKATRRFRFPY